jgi:hypothetical protein
MILAQKIGSFLFGVALMCGAPVVAFLVVFSCLASFYSSAWWWTEGHPSLPVAFAILFASPLVAFVSACLWRREHRRVPASPFIAEVIVAAFIGCLFIWIYMAGQNSAYHAEWG